MSVTTTSKHYFGSGTPYYYGKMTLTSTQSNTAVTVSWKVELIQKYGSKYGVGVKISGAASGSATGYASSIQSTEHTICSKSGTVTFTRSTSARSKSFTVTAYGTSVSGYGSAGGSVSASASVSVPALASYTISYNANGGSGAPAKQTKYYGQAKTLSTTKPTKSGYTFVGWNTSSTATSATYSAGGSYTANASVTLYAIWKKTITLSYNANNGSGAPASQSYTVYNSTTSYSFTISSTRPTRSGYNFLGWATSASATSASKQPGNSYSISSNTTLYAVWQVAYVPPKITNIVAYRVDSNGLADDEGTYMYLSFNWSIDGAHATMNGVSNPIKVDTKQRQASTWSTIYTSSASGTSGRVEQSPLPGGSFSAEFTHDIRIVVTDDKGSSSYTTFLSPAYFTMDVRSGGHGIAFGAPAKKDGFLVRMPDNDGETLIHTEATSGFVGLKALRENTGANVSFGVGSGGDNCGVYSSSLGKWIIHFAESTGNAYLLQTVPIEADGTALTLGGTLTVQNHETPIGSQLSGNVSKSIANGSTLVEIGNCTVPAGAWIVMASFRFPSNSTGNRGGMLYFSGSAQPSSRGVSPTVSGNELAIQVTGSVNTIGSTCAFYAYQTSGAAMNVTVYWRMMRIA